MSSLLTLTSEQQALLSQHKQFPEQIIRNAVRTPDGTVLESKHRHDFKMHTDAITDESVSIDGGFDYLRRVGMFSGCVDMSVTTQDEFESIRAVFAWGTYGKDGKQPLSYVKLKDMASEHIQAVLDTQERICGTVVEQLFKQELLYRSFQQGQDNVL